MVEVEVTRLEHSHDLNADGRLAVEGYRRLLDELADQSLERDVVNLQVAAVDEVLESGQ